MLRISLKTCSGQEVSVEAESLAELKAAIDYLEAKNLLKESTAIFAHEQTSMRSDNAQESQPSRTNPDRSILARIVNYKNDEFTLITKLSPKNGKERIGDAALILLLAAKQIKGNDQVTSATLSKWLKLTGYGGISRLAITLQSHKDSGLVLSQGTRKGATYRLTQAGVNRALEVANEIISVLSRC